VVGPDPVSTVARQLNAYNRREVGTFMTCPAQDARILALDGAILAEGWVIGRDRHRRRFEEPYVKGKWLANLAVDHERVTRRVDGAKACRSIGLLWR